MPDLERERSHGGLVCGIDEVGRGPWAGPVVAAAVIIRVERGRRLPAFFYELDDSKRVPPERRAALAAELRAAAGRGLVRFGVGAASAAEIDRVNILVASHIAMARAVARLGVRPDLALVDGDRVPALPCAVEAIVGGDGLCTSIAAASIIAKVARDALMERLHERYPGYCWDTNKGYGTPEHAEALVGLGPSPHHRLSWGPVRHQQLSLSL